MLDEGHECHVVEEVHESAAAFGGEYAYDLEGFIVDEDFLSMASCSLRNSLFMMPVPMTATLLPPWSSVSVKVLPSLSWELLVLK